MSHWRPGRVRSIVLVLTVVALLVVADAALARVGGGQRYGGGGSGGGGGGGGGFGWIFYMLIRLAIAQPVIGIPLLIVAVFLFIKFGKKARSAQTAGTIRKAQRLSREQSAHKREENLLLLKERDPGFETSAFLERMNRAFLRLQEEYSKQDLSNVEYLLSDGVRERFRLQLEMDRSEGIRNALEDAKVLSSRIVSISSDRHFDTIHVEFRATGKDVDYDVKTGKKLRTNTSSPFVEYWSFLRKPGAKTLDKPGLVEGYCPNCGTPLEMSDTGKCQSCDSLVTSGEYDWVLTEITQAIEWQAVSDPLMIPGYPKMTQLDPGFSLQHIEDRTSVVFWRLMAAHFHNDIDAVRKVFLPDYLAEYAPRIRKQDDEWWVYFREAAIGAVEIQSIQPGEEGGLDRIDVLVKWSARNAYRNAQGRSRGAGEKTIRPQIYVLVRNHGVKTEVGQSFRSAHCQGCGAPFEGGDTGACDYCGRPLNDGSQDWVLADIQRFSASRIRAAAAGGGIGRHATVPAEVLLAGMAAAMYVDGHVDEKEEEMLAEFARARQISDEQLTEVLNSVKSGENLPIPETAQETREILAAMARVTLADGKISKAEESMLIAYGAAKGMTRADVRLILNQQKTLLYKEAKASIKQMKGA